MKHIKIADIQKKTLFQGFEARVIHTKEASIAYVDIAEGSELPVHSHHNEQTLNLIQGEMELVVNGERMILNSGESVILPSNVEHGGKAITKCTVQDIFVPRREDWID